MNWSSLAPIIRLQIPAVFKSCVHFLQQTLDKKLDATDRLTWHTQDMSFFGPLSCLSVMRRGQGLLGPLVRMKRQGVRHMGIFGEPTLVGEEDRVFHCREGKVMCRVLPLVCL